MQTEIKSQAEPNEVNLDDFDIPPHIKAVMKGAPPRYLDDEIEAIKWAKKIGWRAMPDSVSIGVKPGGYMEYLEKHPEEADRILREHGIDPDEIDRILEQGGGTLPGWNGKKKNK